MSARELFFSLDRALRRTVAKSGETVKSGEVAIRPLAEVRAWHDGLAARGVVVSPLDPRGPPVARRFADSREEYASLHDGVGLVDNLDRVLVRVTGEQAIRMLRGLVTADLAPLERQTAVLGFFLTPKGRPLAIARMLHHPRGATVDVPHRCAAPLLEHLARYLPPLYATFEVARELGVLSLVGPRSEAALVEALNSLGLEGAARARELGFHGVLRLCTREPEGTCTVVRREEVEGPGFDLYVPVGRLEGAWEALASAACAEGGGPAGREAYDVWRVERGLPEYGRDITTENLPQETGLEARAISFDKGCYTGQEVVARIHYRGHVNRRLCGLRFVAEDDELPPERAELFRDGRSVGQVTSAVRSPRLGAIGLGYVRREVEIGTSLALAPEDVEVVEVCPLRFTEG